MDRINIRIEERNKILQVEETTNELLDEVNFIVGFPDENKFIMAYGFDKDRLTIQGSAPYEALHNQETISSAIEAFYL